MLGSAYTTEDINVLILEDIEEISTQLSHNFMPASWDRRTISYHWRVYSLAFLYLAGCWHCIYLPDKSFLLYLYNIYIYIYIYIYICFKVTNLFYDFKGTYHSYKSYGFMWNTQNFTCTWIFYTQLLYTLQMF